VALGEAGLDYHYDNSPREAQAQGFRTHIAAARATQLPLVIHTREADDDCARILEDEMGQGAFPAVLHCYTGGPELARRAVALGCYIGFTGIVTFKNSAELRAIAKDLPADRFLVETDAPISLRCPIAASATSRPMWSKSPRCWPKSAAYRSRRFAARRPIISSACSRRCRAPPPRPRDTDLHHFGLRVIRRRATARHWLGRVRSGQPEEPPPPLFRCWSSAKARSASPACLVDTGPDLREQVIGAGVDWLDGILYTTSTPTTRMASTTCAGCAFTCASASTSTVTTRPRGC